MCADTAELKELTVVTKCEAIAVGNPDLEFVSAFKLLQPERRVPWILE
jgi:hypothetical protein